jgi:hypothetical protein
MFRLSCSGYPVLAVLYWLSSVPAVLFRLSCSGCSVLAVLSWLCIYCTYRRTSAKLRE